MAVTLTGTSSGAQGLFNRLGKLGDALNDANAARLAFDTAVSNAMALWDGSSTTIRGTVAGLPAARSQAQGLLSSYVSAYKSAAQRCLIEMFDASTPLPKRDISHALDALYKQMVADGAYFDANTVSAVATQTSLTGNGNTVTSVKDGRGRNLENLISERLLLTCTGDSTSGSERIRIRGEESLTDRLSCYWPLGSGADRTITSVDALASGSKLSNGGFETFSVANTPDNWTLSVGTPGTHIYSEASTVYKGAKSLKILGNGSTLVEIRQTLTGLKPLTPYAFNFWCRNSTNPAAGSLTVDLYDGSGVINDEAGTANTSVFSLTALGTSFVAKSGVFRLPEPAPATVQIRWRLDTAITNTHSLYLDQLAFAEMTQAASSLPGALPFVSVFSGATDWSLDDGLLDAANTWKIETANDRASLWQQLMDKFFDTSDSGVVFPVSGSTLINDSLIA